MNHKIKSTITEIEKTREKIATLQARLKELEQRKTELENLEIISLVRGMNVDTNELAAFAAAYKSQAENEPVPNLVNMEETHEE